MLCVETYQTLYRKDPDGVAFCPYRISPLGAHIDHQFGKINGLAINKGIHFAYSRKTTGICEIQSVNFPGKRAQFHLSSIPEIKQGDWADHLHGAVLKLSENINSSTVLLVCWKGVSLSVVCRPRLPSLSCSFLLYVKSMKSSSETENSS